MNGPRDMEPHGWWSRSNVVPIKPDTLTAGLAPGMAPEEPLVDSTLPGELQGFLDSTPAPADLEAGASSADTVLTPHLQTMLAGAVRLGEQVAEQRMRRRWWDGFCVGVLGTALTGLCIVAAGRLLAQWLQ